MARPRDIFEKPEGADEFEKTGIAPGGAEAPPEPAPEPEVQAQAEPEPETPEPEPAPEPTPEPPAPGSLEALPDDLREAVGELPEGAQALFLDQHRQLHESRSSHAERRRQLKELQDRERGLLDSRAQWAETVLQKFGQDPGSPQSLQQQPGANLPPAAEQGIPVAFNEGTGQYEVPPDVARRLIDQQVQGTLQQQGQAQQAATQRTQRTQHLISQAQLPDNVQSEIAQAWRFLAQRSGEVFQAYGRAPQNLMEIQDAYARNGVASELSAEFPGIDMNDVLELDFLAATPENSGRRIPELLSRYRPAAPSNGQADPLPETPSVAKPRPLSQRGRARTAGPPDPVKKMAGMSPNDLLDMTPAELVAMKEELSKHLGVKL